MPTIAVINNEPTLLRALGHDLDAAGYDVGIYLRSDHGLSALLRDLVDLALIDATNAPLGGVEMLRCLRRHTSMPVVFYSAWSLELKKQLVGTGIEADDYIQIPVSRGELMARIARVVR